MIKAVIFDMDGLLVDSEPFWQSSEIEIFKTVGIELTIERCLETKGMRIDEMVNYWYRKYPWHTPDQQAICEAIIGKVKQSVNDQGKPMPGVYEILNFIKGKNLQVGLASSSPLPLIHAVLDKLQITEYFDVIRSAEHEELGKPHPSVYLSTAQQLDLPVSQCLVFEDSLSGVISAKAARMKCVAVPEKTIGMEKFAIADYIVTSLSEVNDDVWEILNVD